MTPAEAIVEKIHAALQSGIPNAALAVDFAAECARVNSRLEQIREIVDSGQELQALLMAENPPSVLDEASRLQSIFTEWTTICTEHGLAMPPPLLSNAAQRLNLLYDKGISADHKIYKDFREAVMSRNDARALEIARAIEKLNPSDSNAGAERARLETKVFRARELALGEALNSGDMAAILHAMDALESMALPELESSSETFALAAKTKKEIFAQQAAGEIHEHYLPALEANLRDQDWRAARESLSRIDAIISEHGTALEPASKQLLTEAKSFIQQEVAALQRQNEFVEAQRRLLIHMDHIDTFAQDRGVPNLKQARSLFSDLKQHWQMVESFTKELPAEVVQRVSKQVDFLELQIDRLQRRNFILVASLSVLAVLLVGTSGWWLLGIYNAKLAATEIRESISRKLVGSVQKLTSAAQEKSLSKFSPELVSALAEAESFLTAENARLDAVVLELTEWEKHAEEEFVDAAPLELQEKWSRFESEVTLLAEESQGPLVPRINKTGRKVKEIVSIRSSGQFTELAKQIKSYQDTIAPTLLNANDLLTLQKATQSARSALDSWKPLLTAPNESNPVPPDLQTRAEGFQDQLKNIEEELQLAMSSQEAMSKAQTLDAFLEARATFSTTLDSAPTKDINQARIASLIPVSSEKILSELLMPWDSTAWPIFCKGGEAQGLQPAELSPSEVAAYKKLLDQKFCTDIYISEIVGENARTIYSEKKPLINTTPDTYLNYKGDVYDPAKSSTGRIVFIEREYTSNPKSIGEQITNPLISKGLSGFSKMFQDMRLLTFIDSDDRPQFSVWELIDRATSSGNTDPVYLAFIIQNIQDMIKGRPREWGAHFTPTFGRIASRFDELLQGNRVHNGAWMDSKDMREKLGSVDIAPTSLKTEAIFNKTIAEQCKRQSFQFAGFMGPDGKPVVLKSTDAWELWGLSGSAKSPQVALVATRVPDSGDWQPAAPAIPYTPIFAFAGDRQEILSAASKKAGLNSLDAAPVAIPPLFLTAETPVPESP